MKIVILHGQKHKGSTWNIVNMLLYQLQDEANEIEEFYVTDFPSCIGCFRCFYEGEQCCPHYESVNAIAVSLEQADMIFLESPCYCMGMSGQLKSFLDHMGYRWMPHRPDGKMFQKIGVTLSTAAGMGSAKTAKEMKRHLFYWGVGKQFSYGANVNASSWSEVSQKKKTGIKRDIAKLAYRIKKAARRGNPSFFTKLLFYMMRLSQKDNSWNPADRTHWEENGWLGSVRPWK
ncbi:MAG: flavodoxin family protein [Anaerofustis sp.]